MIDTWVGLAPALGALGMVFAGLQIYGCALKTTESQMENWKAEIVKME